MLLKVGVVLLLILTFSLAARCLSVPTSELVLLQVLLEDVLDLV